MTETATAQPSDRSLSIMLWLVATGFFMQTLDSTIVNTALPAMARSLGEAPLRMQGVVIAYSLTMAMMIPDKAALIARYSMGRSSHRRGDGATRPAPIGSPMSKKRPGESCPARSPGRFGNPFSGGKEGESGRVDSYGIRGRGALI